LNGSPAQASPFEVKTAAVGVWSNVWQQQSVTRHPSPQGENAVHSLLELGNDVHAYHADFH
jgi:hypothetical protein